MKQRSHRTRQKGKTMNTNAPNSVCWNITSRCNDKCKFCYREKYLQELSYDEQKRVIDNLAGSGVRKLTFAGGEPLLVKNINELILYAKSQGLLVGLTTNSILLENNQEECEFLWENLDWLTLSLDGADDVVQTKMSRNATHATRVKNLLERANAYKSRKCKLKVNTVVSSVNKDDIAKLADVIRRYNIKRWKLFQFTPVRGEAVETQADFNISLQDFEHVVESMRAVLQGEDIILSSCNQENIQSAYFVIFPNGEVRVTEEGQEHVVGSMLTDEVQMMWSRGGFLKDIHEERTGFIRNAA